jgi:hypothetical protein
MIILLSAGVEIWNLDSCSQTRSIPEALEWHGKLCYLYTRNSLISRRADLSVDCLELWDVGAGVFVERICHDGLECLDSFTYHSDPASLLL